MSLPKITENVFYSDTGQAIIFGNVVPAGEVKVLKKLLTFSEPVVAKALTDAVHENSYGATYSFLSRLIKRGLVEKKEVHMEICGIKTKRITYQATDTVRAAMS